MGTLHDACVKFDDLADLGKQLRHLTREVDPGIGIQQLGMRHAGFIEANGEAFRPMGVGNNYALVRIHVAGVHAEARIAEAHGRPFGIDLMHGQTRKDTIGQYKHPGKSTTGYHRHHFINARAVV